MLNYLIVFDGAYLPMRKFRVASFHASGIGILDLAMCQFLSFKYLFFVGSTRSVTEDTDSRRVDSFVVSASPQPSNAIFLCHSNPHVCVGTCS